MTKNNPIVKSGFINNLRTILFLSGILLLCCLLLFTNFLHFSNTGKNVAYTVLIMIASLDITILLIIIIVAILGTLKKKFGIYDFFIGEEGTYSLSRLQALLWAIVIISYQLSVIISLLVGQGSLQYYEASFSESSIWLLGLSLSSYIVVRGIMVNKIIKQPSIKNSRSKNPEWCDVLLTDDKLDFAKLQMLIWTIIAIFAYLSSCYYFLGHLLTDTRPNITCMFRHFYEDYALVKIDNKYPDLPFVPFLPWTFVVLMGLSQGAYVGKKLIPTFKEEDAVQQDALSYEDKISRLDIEITTKQNLLSNLKPITTMGIQNMKQLQLLIQDLLNEKAGYELRLNRTKNKTSKNTVV